MNCLLEARSLSDIVNGAKGGLLSQECSCEGGPWVY